MPSTSVPNLICDREERGHTLSFGRDPQARVNYKLAQERMRKRDSNNKLLNDKSKEVKGELDRFPWPEMYLQHIIRRISNRDIVKIVFGVSSDLEDLGFGGLRIDDNSRESLPVEDHLRILERLEYEARTSAKIVWSTLNHLIDDLKTGKPFEFWTL